MQFTYKHLYAAYLNIYPKKKETRLSHKNLWTAMSNKRLIYIHIG